MSGTVYLALILLLVIGFFSLKQGIKETRDVLDKSASGEILVEYLGGSPRITEMSSGYIKPRENVLAFTCQDGGKSVYTKWNAIKSVEVKTHEQITNDVTLGRVLALGVFALAAKKQNVHTKQYLVIHCEEEGVNYDMLFTGEGIGTLASRINKALIDYRKANVSITQLATN